MAVLTPLETMADLDAALAGSTERPILIFKHSITCGSSEVAREEIEEVSEAIDHEGWPIDLYIVRVQAARAVSNDIEARLRVRHESPQVLLISNGQVIWRATHFRVTAMAIAGALRHHVGALST
jgi:bacillithiol system protein YtxJ